MEPREDFARPVGAKSAAHAYELARKDLLREFGTEFYRAYIDPLRLVAEWKGSVLFKAGSTVAQERLRQQAQHRIEARLREHEPSLGPIEILLEREIPEEVRDLADARIEEAQAQAREAAAAEHPLSYTFETFCTDQSNFRAFTVAQMIASGAGRAFPIWLLHSSAGCGKTHLLHSIAHDCLARSPERKVLLMTGQEFMESFLAALHKKRDSSVFKEHVRAPDLLLIDDFHRICGKKATEEEAFDAMAEVVKRGGQVVLAANHGAEGLHGLDDTLRAKLKGATTCEITEPNAELRRKILDMRARHYAKVTPGFQVAGAALDLIAERMHVTGRELDGAVSQLVIEWKINGGREVTVEAAANALQAKLSDAPHRRVTVGLVQKVVARHYSMTVPQLLERTRRQSVARPRQIAMYLACKLTNASLPDIGCRFGNAPGVKFDHTTILYARERIAELLQTDLRLRQEIETLIRLIRREA